MTSQDTKSTGSRGHVAGRSNIVGAETDTSSIRDRFGGIDTPASLVGMFAAFGVLGFLSALIAAGAGGLDFQLNAYDLEGNLGEVVWGGVILAAVAVFVSFFVGGWGAGRMARYDGGITGVGTALWALLLIAVFAALGAFVGAEYNAFQRAGLPDWFSQIRGDDVTTAAVVAAVLGVVALTSGAYLGGKLGEVYHRNVDAALLGAANSTDTIEVGSDR